MRSRRPDPAPAAPAPADGTTVRVLIPGILRSYTDGADRLDVAVAAGVPGHRPTLAAVLAALDTRCPGLAFRIVDEQGRLRPHVKVFCGPDAVRDLATPVPAGAEVMLVGALSGG